jgi:protein-tyrosine-phosphatase
VRGGVLVVCQGNICRSPYAASVLAKHLEGDGVRVRSAGLIGPGRPAPRQAQQVAASRGIDLSGHRSQLLSREVAEAAGLVVVMSREQRASFRSRYGELRPVLILGDLDPGKIESRQIPDPINRDHAYYARVYDRIDRCTARLAELLSGRRSSEAPSLANR